MATVLKGECECRATQDEVLDEFAYAANCHCSRCRAGTGTAFKAFGGIQRDRLGGVEGGGGLLGWGDDEGNHTRCGVCGSLLYSVVRDGGWVHVAFGSLAAEPGRPPGGHSYVGAEAASFEMHEHL